MHKFRWRKRDHPDWEALRNEAAEISKSPDIVIVSNETLWKKNEEELQFFKSFFPNFEFSILLYVREQVEYLNSRALQSIKQDSGPWNLDFNGQNAPENLDEFLENFVSQIDYYEVARRWEDVFGKGSVQVRLYDREVLSSGNVVEDFYEAVGAKTDRLDMEIEVNPSLSVPYAAILKEADEFSISDLAKSDVLEMALRLSRRRTTNPRKVLSAEKAGMIRTKFENSNRALFDEYVSNADGFSIQEYDEGDFYDLPELAEELKRLVVRWPLISMLEENPVDRRWFQEGWRTRKWFGAKAVQVEPDATIRFRFHMLKGYWLAVDEFGIRLTCGERSAPRLLAVNGKECGLIDVARDIIPIPHSLLGEDDNVEVCFSFPSEKPGKLTVLGGRFEEIKRAQK